MLSSSAWSAAPAELTTAEFRPTPLPALLLPNMSTTAWADALSLGTFSSHASVREIAFVDAALPDYQTLVDGLQPGTAVYLLNPTGDELSQISSVLAGYSNLASVSVFSHGSNGALQLGNTSLNTSNLMDYAGILQSWASSFSAEGDLLLMGCDLAADGIGQRLMSQIAALTGADVAASTDLTGSHALGGDWDLEFTTGSIEAPDILQVSTTQTYAGVLALSFAPATTFSVDLFPEKVALGDVNNDGNLDIVNASRLGIRVLIGSGAGDFTTLPSIAASELGQIYSVALGDLNDDGNLDMVTGSSPVGSSNYVSRRLGNGDGTFGDYLLTTGSYIASFPYSLAIADFNGDAKLDLVSANGVDNSAPTDIGVLLNFSAFGSYGFLNAAVGNSYPVGRNPRSVAVQDLNGDGNADIVTANQASGDVSVLLGSGDGTFGTTISLNPGTTNLYSVAIADLNRDNRPDIVTTSLTGNVSVLLANGNANGTPTFSSPTLYAAAGINTSSIAIADLDGDGNLDLVVTNAGSPNFSVLLGNGDGTFGTATTFRGGSIPLFVAVGDFNSDSKPDLAIANQGDNVVSVFLNTSTFFSPPIATPDTGSATETGGVNDSVPGNNATGNVLSNDTTASAGGTLSISAIAFGNTTGTVGSGLAGAYGILTLNSDGAYTYVVDNANTTVQALNVGQTLTETFSYTAEAALSSLSATSTLTITINGTNDAPLVNLASGAANQTVSTTSAPITGISISDVDGPIPGSTEKVTLSVGNGSLNVTNLNGATIAGAGTSSVTLSGTVAQINAALATLNYSSNGFTGNTTLSVVANDGQYDSPGQTRSLTVVRNVGTLGNPAVNVSGTVSSSDNVDYYQFTLGQATNKFRFTLGDLSANANLVVYRLNSDGSRTRVLSSSNTGTRAEVLNNQALATGTYLIEVLWAETGNGSTSYNLNFKA